MGLLAEGRPSESRTDGISAPQQGRSRQNVGPHYHAFISYSRAADGQLAPVLQSALQRFAKPWYRQQILRIFRDQTSLEMTPDVWPEIRRALDASEFFILLASPEAARSQWVALEVEHWLSHKLLDRVLIVLTSGSLVWDPKSDRFDPQRSNALPLPLLIQSKGLPNYADLTTQQQSEQLDLKNPAFLDAIASLAARIHGKRKDELTGEEVRQHRRFKAVATCAATLVVTLAAAMSVAAYVAVQQRDAALATTGRLLGSEAQRRLRDPATDETSPVLAAFATAGWRLSRTSDAWNAMQRLPLVSVASRHLHGDTVTAVAFSPDGEIVATASQDRTARILSVRDSREIARVTHNGAVRAAVFSPDGQRLATASMDGSVRVVSVPEGREIARIDHDDAVWGVVFSPDGARLATASQDRTARIVATDGHEIARAVHDYPVIAVAFSPDGQLLATASGDIARETGEPVHWKGENRIAAVEDVARSSA